MKVSELTFWEEYISCIEFLNDDQHVIVGSGDGTARICNYINHTQLYQWKCDSDIISIDYLYLNPEDLKHMHSAYNRAKSPTIPRKSDNNNKYSISTVINIEDGKKSPGKKKKPFYKKRPRFKKMKEKRKKAKQLKEMQKNKSASDNDDNDANKDKPDFYVQSSGSNETKDVRFDGVHFVSSGDLDDGSDSDSFSGNMSNYSGYRNSRREHDFDMNVRQIMVIIGSASTKNHNVYIDEYQLNNMDNNDNNDENKNNQNNQKQKCQIKDLIKSKVKFSLSLGNKKCESVQFSPNGKYFAIGGEACLYQIYDRITMKMIHQRFVKDNEDSIVIQRRPNLATEFEKKRLKTIKDNDEELNNDDDNNYFVTCLSWINDHTVAVGNSRGSFIYVSTILHEYKIRNFVLKEWIQIIDKHFNICNDDKSRMNADNLIEEIHEFIGCDVVDNVIETQFGDKTSCLTSHPYFEMRSIDNHLQTKTSQSVPTTPISYPYQNGGNRKEGLYVSGSWSGVFQGCVLKG